MCEKKFLTRSPVCCDGCRAILASSSVPHAVPMPPRTIRIRIPPASPHASLAISHLAVPTPYEPEPVTRASPHKHLLAHSPAPSQPAPRRKPSARLANLNIRLMLASPPAAQAPRSNVAIFLHPPALAATALPFATVHRHRTMLRQPAARTTRATWPADLALSAPC